MPHINNIEIKAKCNNTEEIRHFLRRKGKSIGIDRQIDTYFNVPSGRLKLREGKIENALIYYERSNIRGPKKSKIIVANLQHMPEIKEILKKLFGIFAVVDKKREIYFIDNVKFHLDIVKGLGSFIEVEAIDKDRSIGFLRLKKQCEYYTTLFGIKKEDMIDKSYSDLV